MYKISVPVMSETLKRSGREETLLEIKKFDASRVFVALPCYETDEGKRKKIFEEAAYNCRFFKENGFEVGIWMLTFQFENNISFKNMVDLSGKELKNHVCPSDESFVEFAKDYIKLAAECEPDMIMFDDDFRYGFFSAATACLCEEHIKRINSLTGEVSTRAELEKHITSGGKNKYRDAYLKVNGEIFKSFAREMRSAVDEINPSIRLGACACMTSWDIDGIDALELSKILAGNTKPFVRLIGAPYWAAKNAWGNQLQDVVELTRMESAWTKFDDVEIMAEGDVYPRPRMQCSAAFLEGFDTAVRASGSTDGILKYGMDYRSNAGYETGYSRFHERNREVYKKIDELFQGKKHCGIRVYESMKKVSDMVMPTKVNNDVNIQNLFFSKAARTLAYNTIPTVYEGKGICGIVFDENARNLPFEALDNGLIIDIAAAEILMSRGVDVGIDHIGESETGTLEHFADDNNYILMSGAVVYDIKLRSGAEILSDTEVNNKTIPVSVRYENAKGQRFLILNINTRSDNDSVLKHYARSRQYALQAQWLGGEKLPAYSYGHPELYIQCKEKDGKLAAGLWNFFPDIAIEPVIELGREYTKIKFLNCSGRLCGDKVYLSDIPAFGFAAFEII